MALTSGNDYAFHPKTTYVGSAGVGEGCIVATAKRVLMVPLTTTEAVWHSHVTETRYSLAGRPVDVFFHELLATPDLTVEALEELMALVADRIPAAALGDLTEAKRLKVSSGLLSKGLYFNNKESGLGGWGGYPLKGKEHLQAFQELYAQSEILVTK